MAADDTIAEDAPAKVNLYLHVTGRRDDGYHLLDSLVVFADTGDRVTARPAETLSLTYSGAFAAALPAPADNLVMQAARRLAAVFAITDGAALTLEKRLPVASGIGGGSADAAAALRALCRLWGLDPADHRVRELALALGADVPVCLLRRAAIMRGIGESLTLIDDAPKAGLVLVNPGVGVATPAVFKARSGPFSAPVDWSGAVAGIESLTAALAPTGNDLEAPAIGIAPVIGEVLAAMRQTAGIRLARMSGSGATCFALTADRADADAARNVLATAHPDWWVCATAIA